ncbi:hypothetical protein [Ureibacillus sp. FSL K6-2830]|uniref:hypothetical protein n=1 Tax=Ureibacillus sp. FSL K6-2830 TaxID=2954610 RepID=UPI0030F537AE
MTAYIQKLKQFLSDEKELLTDLAIEVANADNDHEYREAKAKYNEQRIRVQAIQDAIDLASSMKAVS